MSVTEILMRPGRFEVNLVGRPGSSMKPASGTPASVLSAAALGSFVVITPTRIQPIGAFSDANVLSAAIYSGVINQLPDRYTIAGQGLSWFMGTDEGLGDQILTKVSLSAATLSTGITALKPASISAGTVTDTGTSATAEYQFMTPREAITNWCRKTGAEWRLNPNNTLDAATPATLFGSTAKGLITRKPEGSEGTLRGFEATDIIAGSNLDGYTTTTVVVGKTGDGAAVATGSASGPNVYKDFLNANMVMERLVDAPQEPAATVAAYATSVQNLFGSVRRSIQVNTRTFAVPLDVRPGNYVYVYDPDSNTVDTSVQQQWRGETIAPVLLRCRGYTWGLKAGMGVYIRTSAGVYTDISDWVDWENELDTSWELGSSSTDVDQNPDQLGAAFLGVNADIVARTTGGLIPFTPTWSGTLGNGTIEGYYTINSGWCTGYISLVWGNTTSHGAAVQVFGTPVTSAIAARLPCGAARLEDNGTGNFARTAWLVGTSSIRLTSEAGVEVTNAVPFTFTTSDSVRLSFGFPIA